MKMRMVLDYDLSNFIDLYMSFIAFVVLELLKTSLNQHKVVRLVYFFVLVACQMFRPNLKTRKKLQIGLTP